MFNGCTSIYQLSSIGLLEHEEISRPMTTNAEVIKAVGPIHSNSAYKIYIQAYNHELTSVLVYSPCIVSFNESLIKHRLYRYQSPILRSTHSTHHVEFTLTTSPYGL